MNGCFSDNSQKIICIGKQYKRKNTSSWNGKEKQLRRKNIFGFRAYAKEIESENLRLFSEAKTKRFGNGKRFDLMKVTIYLRLKKNSDEKF